MNIQFQPDFRTAERGLPFECVALGCKMAGAPGSRIRAPLAMPQALRASVGTGLDPGRLHDHDNVSASRDPRAPR